MRTKHFIIGFSISFFSFFGISYGQSNTFTGAGAGANTTNGNNSAFGNLALNSQSGQYNSAFGKGSLEITDSTSVGNCAFGFEALKTNLGTYNVGIGYRALRGSVGTIGDDNIAIGLRTLESQTTGIRNIAIGRLALQSNTEGTNNIGIGQSSLSNLTSISNENIALGASSGSALTSGSTNIFIGVGAGQGISNGSNNTFIGRVSVPGATKTPLSTGSDTNGTIILANGLGNQRLLINDINGYTGIGLGNNVIPENRLHIGTGISGTSGLRFKGINSNTIGLPNIASPINNKFLTVNLNGDVVLQNLPAGSSGTVSIANGTNTTVTGTGVAPTPYVINATNIYTNDGTLSGNRTVTMANNRLMFNTFADGRIYIGNTSNVSDNLNFPTATGAYRLYVEGGILTEKVKVALRSSTNWADYVFASDYKLKPLKEVETFIKENKHLPGISSASELVKEGLDLAYMQAKQMEKIEELTLYTIEQNKQIEKQNKDIEELKEQVRVLLEKK